MSQLLKLGELQEAYARLQEGLNTAKEQLEVDGVLQRFEFTLYTMSK